MRAIKAAQQSQTCQVIAAEDEITNPNGGPEFMAIVKARLDRRNFLRGTGASAAVAAIGTVGLSACGGGGDSTTPPLAGTGINKPTALTFANVDKSREDRFTVPTGYTARAFYRTGDPMLQAWPPTAMWAQTTLPPTTNVLATTTMASNTSL